MPVPATNALHARMEKKKKERTRVGLAGVKRKLWIALLHAMDVLEHATEEEPELRLKAVHAISQVSGQLVKVFEVGELEARLLRLEAKLLEPKAQL